MQLPAPNGAFDIRAYLFLVDEGILPLGTELWTHVYYGSVAVGETDTDATLTALDWNDPGQAVPGTYEAIQGSVNFNLPDDSSDPLGCAPGGLTGLAPEAILTAFDAVTNVPLAMVYADGEGEYNFGNLLPSGRDIYVQAVYPGTSAAPFTLFEGGLFVNLNRHVGARQDPDAAPVLVTAPTTGHNLTLDTCPLRGAVQVSFETETGVPIAIGNTSTSGTLLGAAAAGGLPFEIAIRHTDGSQLPFDFLVDASHVYSGEGSPPASFGLFEDLGSVVRSLPTYQFSLIPPVLGGGLFVVSDTNAQVSDIPDPADPCVTLGIQAPCALSRPLNAMGGASDICDPAVIASCSPVPAVEIIDTAIVPGATSDVLVTIRRPSGPTACLVDSATDTFYFTHLNDLDSLGTGLMQAGLRALPSGAPQQGVCDYVAANAALPAPFDTTDHFVCLGLSDLANGSYSVSVAATELSVLYTSWASTPVSLNCVDVNPGAGATQLAFGTAPRSYEYMGQIWQTFTVEVRDALNALVTGDNSTQITFTKTSGESPSMSAGTLVQTAIGGVVSFSDLVYSNSVQLETVGFDITASGLLGLTGNSVQMASPPNNLALGTPPLDYVANQTLPAFTIEVRNAVNGLVSVDDDTQVTLSLFGGTGSITGTLTRQANNGVATFDDIQFDTPGIKFVDFTAPGLTPISNLRLVMSGPADHLAFGIAPPGTAVDEQAWASFTVEVQDASNFVVPTATHLITITKDPLIDNLSLFTAGTSVNAVGGIATFSALVYNSVGPVAVEPTAFFVNAPGVTGIGSTAINIFPLAGVPYELQINSAIPGTVDESATWNAITVGVFDFYGDPVSGDSGRGITIGELGGGSFSGTLTQFTSAGQAVFDDLSYFPYQNDLDFDFFSSGLQGASAQIDVLPVPVSLAFGISPQESETEDTTWQAFTVEVLDSQGLLLSGDNSTQVTISLASGTGALFGTLTEQAASGVVTFDDVSYNIAESITFDLTAPGLTGISGTNIVIVPDSGATQLAFGTAPQPAEPESANWATFTVEVRDAGGALVTADNTTDITISLATGSGSFSGTLTKQVSGGVATFDDLSFFPYGSITFDATSSPVLTPITGVGMTITAVPYELTLDVEFPLTPPFVEGNFWNGFVVDILDSQGFILTSDNTTQITAAQANPPFGILSGTLTQPVTSGQAFFGDISFDLAAYVDLEFTADYPGVPPLNVTGIPVLYNDPVLLVSDGMESAFPQLYRVSPSDGSTISSVSTQDRYGALANMPGTPDLWATTTGQVPGELVLLDPLNGAPLQRFDLDEAICAHRNFEGLAAHAFDADLLYAWKKDERTDVPSLFDFDLNVLPGDEFLSEIGETGGGNLGGALAVAPSGGPLAPGTIVSAVRGSNGTAAGLDFLDPNTGEVLSAVGPTTGPGEIAALAFANIPSFGGWVLLGVHDNGSSQSLVRIDTSSGSIIATLGPLPADTSALAWSPSGCPESGKLFSATDTWTSFPSAYLYEISTLDFSATPRGSGGPIQAAGTPYAITALTVAADCVMYAATAANASDMNTLYRVSSLLQVNTASPESSTYFVFSLASSSGCTNHPDVDDLTVVGGVLYAVEEVPSYPSPYLQVYSVDTQTGLLTPSFQGVYSGNGMGAIGTLFEPFGSREAFIVNEARSNGNLLEYNPTSGGFSSLWTLSDGGLDLTVRAMDALGGYSGLVDYQQFFFVLDESITSDSLAVLDPLDGSVDVIGGNTLSSDADGIAWYTWEGTGDASDFRALYAASGGDGGGGGIPALYQIDTLTGMAVSKVSLTRFVGGLADAGDYANFWATTVNEPRGQLLSIDRFTGAETVIGDLDEDSCTHANPYDLEYETGGTPVLLQQDPRNGVISLHGIAEATGEMVERAEVAPDDPSYYGAGIVLDPLDSVRAYVSTRGADGYTNLVASLTLIDVETGAILSEISPQQCCGAIRALAADNSGTIWGVLEDFNLTPPHQLVTIDPSDGAITLVTGLATDVNSLAYIPTECGGPSAGLLFAAVGGYGLSSTGDLYSIDPLDPSPNLVDQLLDATEGAVPIAALAGPAMDGECGTGPFLRGVTGAAYATDPSGPYESSLVDIDPSSAFVSNFRTLQTLTGGGGCPNHPFIDDIALHSDGYLYAWDEVNAYLGPYGQVYQVDTGTGKLTPLPNLTQTSGSAYNGVLYSDGFDLVAIENGVCGTRGYVDFFTNLGQFYTTSSSSGSNCEDLTGATFDQAGSVLHGSSIFYSEGPSAWRFLRDDYSCEGPCGFSQIGDDDNLPEEIDAIEWLYYVWTSD
ncbi:MAG: hypothetical protein AB1405_10725 [Bdellovibrionota bacterium]